MSSELPISVRLSPPLPVKSLVTKLYVAVGSISTQYPLLSISRASRRFTVGLLESCTMRSPATCTTYQFHRIRALLFQGLGLVIEGLGFGALSPQCQVCRI